MIDYYELYSKLDWSHKVAIPCWDEERFLDLCNKGDIIYISTSLASKINMWRTNYLLNELSELMVLILKNEGFKLDSLYLFNFDTKVADLYGVKLRFIIDESLGEDFILLNRDGDDSSMLKMYRLA